MLRSGGAGRKSARESPARASRSGCSLAGYLTLTDRTEVAVPSRRWPRGVRLLWWLRGVVRSRACLAQFGRAGVGQADQLLTPVVAGADVYPAGVDQGAQVAGER